MTRDSSTELMRTLPASAYLSADHYAREVGSIFYGQWFCAGRAEAVAGAGQFISVDVAGESVIVVRTRTGDLRAFYNVCRHRGSRLVNDAPSGCEPGPHGRFKGAITCPYHAWTYALTGELRAAPFLTEGDGLRKGQLGLHPVAVDTWGGFIFVHLTPAQMGELPAQLKEAVDRTANYPLDDLLTGHRITYDVRANWKVIVENYNECYHCGPVHPELCEVVPAFKKNGGRELDWDAGIPHREGASTFTLSGTTERSAFPGLTQEESTRHKGELIYPNLMLSLSADHVAAFTLWPLGPGRTKIDCDFLFHPDEMRKRSFDPSDAVEFWDLVNRQDWRICESVQKGMTSRVFEYGYYAPMEDLSLDIRRYVRERLGGL